MVTNEVERIAEALNQFAPYAIYLFGSAARGEATDQSDIDILVICDSDEILGKTRKGIRKILPKTSMPIDLLWMTVKEFKRKRDLGGIAFTVSREGELLHRSKRNVDDERSPIS